MIPKTIHYCWFGRNPLPKLAQKCIKSWKKYCPDYEIIEWNEDNFDLSAAPLYVRQAYDAKKWAFVTDFVRLWAVYNNGGVYLDTDVELIKSPDELLKFKAFFGFEDENFVATGLGFGAEKESPVVYEIMNAYKDISFINSDGVYDLTPCPARNTAVFLGHGLKQNNLFQVLNDDTVIFPTDYLNPTSMKNRRIYITENTYSIHHFAASWYSPEQRKKRKKNMRVLKFDFVIHFPNRALRKILGDEKYEKLKHTLKG